MPVRKVRNRGRNTVGAYPSSKLDRMVMYESKLERDVIHLLEFDPTIRTYHEQPFKITYWHEQKKHTYTPDFHITYDDGGEVVVEVKPAKFAKYTENQIKFNAAQRWCEENGKEFWVVTDRQLHITYRTQNIAYLARFADYEIDTEITAYILHAIQVAGQSTIGELISRMKHDNPSHLIIPILHLAYTHKLCIELDNAPINIDTFISAEIEDTTEKLEE